MNALLTWFTIFSFLVPLEKYKSFIKYDGFWYLIYSINISVFIFVSTRITFLYNSDENIFSLFHFCLGAANTVGPASGSGFFLEILWLQNY